MSRSHKLDLREVEVSPDGRYVRFEEKLGSGAYKDVYLAYDTETGKEVAWNTVNLSRIPAGEKRRIRMETEILASLHHPHIINFYHVWEHPAQDQIGDTKHRMTTSHADAAAVLPSLSHSLCCCAVWCSVFTTEIVTSGTLKEYTSRVKNIKLKVIKKCQPHSTQPHAHPRSDPAAARTRDDSSTHPTPCVCC